MAVREIGPLFRWLVLSLQASIEPPGRPSPDLCLGELCVNIILVERDDDWFVFINRRGDRLKLLTFEADDEETEPEGSEPHRPSSRRRGRVCRVIPESLPRVARYQDLDETKIPENLSVQTVRRFYKKAGEYLEWQPPQLYVVEEYVEVLAIDNGDATETTMITAPKQPRILNCLVGPQMLASFATSRFADHQPYYRLEEHLPRSGVHIDRSHHLPLDDSVGRRAASARGSPATVGPHM